MKKTIKILLIIVPLFTIIIIASILSTKQKTINIDEELIKVNCNSGTYYEKNVKDKLPKKIEKGSTLKCTLSIHSPKNEKLTYNEVSFDYNIEGNYEIVERPTKNDELIFNKDNNIHIIYQNDYTINKNKKYETIYKNLYSFKIYIPKEDNDTDKLTFNLSNIKIENNRKTYIVKDYTISYDIEKDSL